MTSKHEQSPWRCLPVLEVFLPTRYRSTTHCRITCTLPIILVTAWFATSAAAAPGGKVELCHLPPDNPGNAHTIKVHVDDVGDHLAHGDFLGACPPTAAELDPPTVWVDTDLTPPAPTIAGIDGGPPRSLVRMNSNIGLGYTFEFVENEVYLVTQSLDDLAAFQSRWPSTVLFQIALPSSDTNIEPTFIYLLNVDPSMANTRRLDKDLAQLDSMLHGQHQVSSEAGLKLLALVAGEIRREGLRLGINVLLRSADFAERISEEAMIGDNQSMGPLSFAYTTNAFEWPYIQRNPDMPGDYQWPLDTGVGEALRVVEAEGNLSNRVRVLIADGGFYPNHDFPPYTMVGPLRTTNPDPEGCGAGTPPWPDSVCGTHGTHVLLAGFGLPDNAFGTLGPGGAVSDVILLQSPSVDAESIVRFMIEAIPAALLDRPQIINISASMSIPSGWCFIACEPVDIVMDWINDRGIIVVAAAGNNTVDVDALDEFCTIGCVTFEEATIIPCETDHVVCVGAQTFFESRRTSYSNYGSVDNDNSVDIFGPGDVYSVDAIQADTTIASRDDLQLISGTSFASPFVAGVFALTWAANPGLTNTQVRNCVLGAAHTESFTGERRRINALGAVSCAMGGTHPWVEILQPSEGAAFVRGAETVTLQAESDDYEDGAPGIFWSSSIDGYLGMTDSGSGSDIGSLGLSVGEHEICAETTDTSDRSWVDCVNVTVTSAPPDIEILSPFTNSRFTESETIQLVASVTDLDGPTPSNIEWRIGRPVDDWDEMVPVGDTLNTSVPASMFGLGEFHVEVRATDDSGAIGDDRTNFHIVPDSDNLPPSITISEPVQGATILSPDGGSVTLQLVASAEDPEDGSIPFADIRWYVRADNDSFHDLPVTTRTICILTNPILMICELYETTHTIELAPVGSQTITRYDIKAFINDSQGRLNSDNNGRVTVFINQFI